LILYARHRLARTIPEAIKWESIGPDVMSKSNRLYYGDNLEPERELHGEPTASLQALYQDIQEGRAARAVALHIADPRPDP
jgi:hypothetical protein